MCLTVLISFIAGRNRFENAREQKVPSSSLSRAFGFAELGLSLAAKAVGGSVKSAFVIGKVACK